MAGGGGAPGVGALRADARSVGGRRRRVVRVAPEPERVTVRLGAAGSARRGSVGARNRQAVLAPRLPAPAPSLRPAATLAAYLAPPAGWSPYLPAHLLARAGSRGLAGPGKLRRGVRRSPALCPRLPVVALERD